MKAIVLGYGVSGKGAVQLLLSKGYEVICVDKDKSKFDDTNITFLEENDQIEFKDVEFLVISSGIQDDHPLCQKAKQSGVQIITEANLAFSYLKNRSVGITGSNGKTTVTKLIEFVLNENKIKARAVGNVGFSLCSYLLEAKDDEILIIEFSSFQLNTLVVNRSQEIYQTKLLDYALLLNITPDHINYHGSFANYANAKLKIQEALKEDGKFFISDEIKRDYEQLLTRKYVLFEKEKIEDVEGKQNLLAAYAICKEFGIDKKTFLKTYERFQKPHHRIEFVTKIKNVSFYDDSKATNIYSTIYAVKNLKDPIILIAGGDDKGLSFKVWNDELKDKVKTIFLIGKCANKIKEELNGFDMRIVYTLQRAVYDAFEIARGKKINILLSPGCSSLDQFKNYEHRGEEFKKFVKEIEKGELI